MSVGQLAVVVQAKSLDAPLVVFVKLNLMLHHFDPCFENALVLDRLSDSNLPLACALAVGRMRAGDFHARCILRSLNPSSRERRLLHTVLSHVVNFKAGPVSFSYGLILNA